MAVALALNAPHFHHPIAALPAESPSPEPTYDPEPAIMGIDPAPELKSPIDIAAMRTALAKRLEAGKKLSSEIELLEKNFKAHPEKSFAVTQYAAKLVALDSLKSQNTDALNQLQGKYRTEFQFPTAMSKEAQTALELSWEIQDADDQMKPSLVVDDPYLEFVDRYSGNENNVLQSGELLRNDSAFAKLKEESKAPTLNALAEIITSLEKQPTSAQVKSYIKLLSSPEYQNFATSRGGYDSSAVIERLAKRPDDADAVLKIINSKDFPQIAGGETTTDYFKLRDTQDYMLKWAEGGLPLDDSGKTQQQKLQDLVGYIASGGAGNVGQTVTALNNQDYSTTLGTTQYNQALRKVAIDNVRRIIMHRALFTHGDSSDQYRIMENATKLFTSPDFARHGLDNNWNESQWVKDAVDALVRNGGEEYGLEQFYPSGDDKTGWEQAIEYANDRVKN